LKTPLLGPAMYVDDAVEHLAAALVRLNPIRTKSWRQPRRL